MSGDLEDVVGDKPVRLPMNCVRRYRSPTGVQVTKTFEKKNKAEAWLAAAKADQQHGTWTDPRLSKTTLDDFYKNHFLPSQVHLALSTQARVVDPCLNQRVIDRDKLTVAERRLDGSVGGRQRRRS